MLERARPDAINILDVLNACERADLFAIGNDFFRALIANSWQIADFHPRGMVEINLETCRLVRALVNVNDLIDSR